MADDTKKAGPPAAGGDTAGQLAALRLELEQEKKARMAAEAAAAKAGAAKGAKAQPVPGVKYYRIKAPHYRHGALYPAGTVVRVEDEVPSKTWVEVKAQKGAKPLLKEMPPEVPDESDLPEPEEVAEPKGRGAAAKSI